MTFATPPASKQTTSVLLIDDSPEDRFAFRRFLTRGESDRFALTEVGNTEAGLEVARTRSFDCVVIDFALPDRNGLEALRTLREELDLPVVMMTGTGNEEIAVEAMKRGAHDYLVKGTTTAASLRIAIQNAIEKHSLQTRLAQQQRREQHIAETLQLALLSKPPVDTFPGLTFELFYQPALDEANIGGDFYDVFALSDRRVAFVVGDVSGKGLTAATWTAKVRYGLRAFLSEYPDPARALSRLNDFICYDQGDTAEETSPTAVRFKFVTLCLLIIDSASGGVHLASAGMDPPLLLRRRPDGSLSGDSSEDRPSFPLGIEPQQTYAVIKTTMTPEDIVIMTTDGITEARRPGSRHFLGTEGVEKIVQEAAQTDTRLESLGNALLDGARAFAGGALRDDACLLLARRI